MSFTTLAVLIAFQAGGDTQQGTLASYLRPEDYPREALLNAEQGTVVFKLEIGKDGVPKGCSVVQSSGSKRLDARTCTIMVERARFRPARDSSGNPIEDTYQGQLTWRIGN